MSSDLEKQLLGSVLTTAEIIYHLPDYPSILQTYVWQDYDTVPKVPNLTSFLNFWETNLDGKLNKVRIAWRGLVSAREFKYVDGKLIVH